MNTHRIGLRFEMELKKKLNQSGLICLNLGYNEIGDLVVINGKTRIIECKTTHQQFYYLSKNPYQVDKLKSLTEHNISVYYAIKFIRGKRSIIRFFIMNNNNLIGIPLKEDYGYSLEEFIEHCKGNYKVGNIKELLNDLESD